MVTFDSTAKTRFLFKVLARARIVLNHSPGVLGDSRHDDRIVFGTDRYEQVTEIFATRDPTQILAVDGGMILDRLG